MRAAPPRLDTPIVTVRTSRLSRGALGTYAATLTLGWGGLAGTLIARTAAGRPAGVAIALALAAVLMCLVHAMLLLAAFPRLPALLRWPAMIGIPVGILDGAAIVWFTYQASPSNAEPALA